MTDPDRIPHGSPEMLRACIREMAWFCRAQTEIAMQHTEVGDDAALDYALRKWAAYTRQALAVMGDLKAMKKKGATS
jgi:hypothetical protein